MGQMGRRVGKAAGGKASAAHRLPGGTVAEQHFRFAFEDDVPVSTWVGLAIIVVGGLMIQFGAEFKW